MPEHKAPRQVPDPDVAVRRPEPTARLIPLIKVTRMLLVIMQRHDAADFSFKSFKPVGFFKIHQSLSPVGFKFHHVRGFGSDEVGMLRLHMP